MLEKPALDDAVIIACLRDQYAVTATQVAFLPLGADANTAVYRVVADDGTPYFLKLRRGAFDAPLVTLPRFLYEQGIRQIIPPLPTRSEALWTTLDAYTAVLYPFVEGRDGYEADLTDSQWVELGAALKHIHTAVVPTVLISRLPRETYSPLWRERVTAFQAQAENDPFADPIAAQLAALLNAKRDVVSDLVGRAERYSGVIQSRPLPFVVCHADLHAGNLLIGADGTCFIVDWDTLILAPKERDLMFIGGGQMANRRTPQAEETLFYAGYGETDIDAAALAYYRYERIVQDIAAYCEQIFLSNKADRDRAEGLRQLSSQFEPNGVIAFAYHRDGI